MAHPTKLTVALVTVLATLGAAPLASAQTRPGHRAHWSGGGQTVGRGGAQPMHTTLDGTLSDQDPVDDQGRHQRVRPLALHRGDSVTFGLSSEDVDTVAMVDGPQGGHWEDDDGAGHGTDSLLRFVAPVDGTYRFIATTYEQGQTGRFHVTMDVQPGGTVDPGSDDNATDAPDANGAAPVPSTGGQTYGVFVGVTHYGGENEDLPGSADDASSLAQAFERAGWMARSHAVVLTDSEATTENVQQAFRRLAPEMTPRDTMVFFFDGHGGDGVLETVGGELTRSDLGRMLDHAGGRQLVVLDTCHAGGFASLTQGHANRWGLFSSRANETSETADEVHAGGWLAYFFRRAVEGGVQRSSDGSVDLARVTQYVQSEYDHRGITQRQHLVASAGNRSGFTLGGHGGAVGAVDTGTAVAARQPVTDDGDDGDAQPAAVNGRYGRRADNGGDNGNADDLGRWVGAGLAVAGQVMQSLVK